MTDSETNRFLTLLMGDCWHEWTWEKDREKYPDYANPDHLANPLPVIRWMEKEMPEVLEEYLCHISEITVTDIDWIEAVINLRNLVAYLVEHDGWGEKKCERCLGLGRVQYYMEECPVCSGSGKIIHPALEYARGLI